MKPPSTPVIVVHISDDGQTTICSGDPMPDPPRSVFSGMRRYLCQGCLMVINSSGRTAPPKPSDRLKQRAAQAERSLTMVMNGIKDLRQAIENKGPYPKHHDAITDRHRKEWPTVWRRIDFLLAEEADYRAKMMREIEEAAEDL